MSGAAIAFAPGQRMIIPFRTPSEPTEPEVGEPLTLRGFYAAFLLPSRMRAARTTRALDRETLTAWEAFTSNPDLRAFDWSTQEATRASLRKLRAELQRFVTGHEQSASANMTTCNKRLRTIRHFLTRAADPIDCGLIPHAPDLGRDFTGTSSRWQMRATKAPPREIVSDDELTRLFNATAWARWPDKQLTGVCPVLLWRVALLLLWSFGARTEDHFFGLTWDLVDFPKRLMRFQAEKTSKLQGVPLTDLLIRALQRIKSCASKLFVGFDTKGTWSKTNGWQQGYYTTWSREILWHGHFAINRGPDNLQKQSETWPDVRPNLMPNHFRKTMVTELNQYSDQAGGWVAAHYMAGVTNQFYDTPDERIRKAVQQREDERLPQCFREYFAE